MKKKSPTKIKIIEIADALQLLTKCVERLYEKTEERWNIEKDYESHYELSVIRNRMQKFPENN